MDDNRSMASFYWDTDSIMSGSVMTDGSFHTPTGSITDMYNCDLTESFPENVTNHLLVKVNGLHISDKAEEIEHEVEVVPEIEVIQNEFENNEATPEDITSNEDETSHSIEVVTKRSQLAVPVRPPPIRLEKCASVLLDTSPKTPEKRDWKRSFAKRVSFTKSKLIKSLSMNKHEHKSRSDNNVLLTMRNSIRRFKSFNKHRSITGIDRKEPNTIKDTLGSDCDYFTYEKDSIQRDSETINEVFDIPVESTPIKPRRQFPQDKYLTGSQEMLQKAYNSLNRKSQVQEDKSIFDICSTLIHLFDVDQDPSSKSTKIPNFLVECQNAFLEMNRKQIDHGLRLINKNLGQHFNLFSENLDSIIQVKKFRVEELLGSSGVCVITDINTRQRFVALRRTEPRNWVSFTGFLQHIDKDTELFDDQTWACYPADSITNMYLERDCFEPRFAHSKVILDCLLQLLILLHSQLTGQCHHEDITPSNVLLISSNLSLICVFDKSPLCPEKDETALQVINMNGDLSMRQSYQDSLMKLNKHVEDFLSDPANSYRLISASYPLDYLFFILVKLHKDINVLLESVS